MSNTKFLIIYLCIMITTYMWRFAAFGAAMEDGADVDAVGDTMNFLMFASYAGMAWVAYARGKAIGKNYLVAFPIVGGVFDLILVFIPLVPTVMNIITIVVGMPDAKPEPKAPESESA